MNDYPLPSLSAMLGVAACRATTNGQIETQSGTHTHRLQIMDDLLRIYNFSN
jgi:hypothetical protein